MRPHAAALALLLAALPARGGVVIEGTSDGQSQRIVLDGKKMRAEGKGNVMIFDGEAKRIVRLDPAAKTWSEFTQADLERVRAQVTKSLEGLPPEQRAQVESALKGAQEPPPPVKWEKTGRSEKAAGKPCDVYRASHGDSVEEVCFATWSAFGLSKGDFAALGAFEDFIRQIGTGLGGNAEDVMWRDAPGVPLATWSVDGAERRESFRATKVEKARPAASEFQPPEGWTKEKTPLPE